MRKRTKKGFTLVELLVVIAILAILASVSVVGYLGFTAKAKESNDVSLTAQMNTALQAEGAVSGNVKTMSEALDILSEAGMDVTKLSPTSQGYNYVYDAGSGKMLLLNEEYKIVAPEGATDTDLADTFAIVDPKEKNYAVWTSKGYGVYFPSTYAFDGEKELSIDKAVSVDTGSLDVDSLKITSDSEFNDKPIIVNTKAEKAVINLPNGAVDMYGEQNFVEATVADHSLDVYGTVLQLNVLKGHVVAMTNGHINTVDTTEATEAVEVTKQGGTIGAVVYDKSKENVTIDSSLEDVKKEKSDVTDGFAGGVGTAASPYLISNGDEWFNLQKLSKTVEGTSNKFFKVISDLDFKDTQSNITINYFNGTIDFSNKNVSVISNQGSPVLFSHVYSGSTIENMNLYTYDTCMLIYTAEVNTDKDVFLKNISIYGYLNITDNNSTPFMWGVHGYNTGGTLRYINCNNYTNIVSTGSASAGIFLGKVCDDPSNESMIFGKAKVSFENCVNNGSLIHSNGYASMLVSNASTFKYSSLADFKVVNCVNNGTILGKGEGTNLFCGSGWYSNTTIESIKAWVTENNSNLKNSDNGSCLAAEFSEINITDGFYDFSNVENDPDYSYDLSINYWVTTYTDSTKENEITHGSYGININLKDLNSKINSYDWISESDIEAGSSITVSKIGDRDVKVCRQGDKNYYVFEKSWVDSWKYDNPDMYVSISNITLSLFVKDQSGKVVSVYTTK